MEETIYNSLVDLVLKDRDNFRIRIYIKKYFLNLYTYLIMMIQILLNLVLTLKM
jgi:hypothetical protein